MTLYEFWNCTLYYQPMFIYLTNVYDQNMPIFKGTVMNGRIKKAMMICTGI